MNLLTEPFENLLFKLLAFLLNKSLRHLNLGTLLYLKSNNTYSLSYWLFRRDSTSYHFRALPETVVEMQTNSTQITCKSFVLKNLIMSRSFHDIDRNCEKFSLCSEVIDLHGKVKY